MWRERVCVCVRERERERESESRDGGDWGLFDAYRE